MAPVDEKRGALPPNIRFIQRGWLNCNSILLLGEGGPALVDSGYESFAEETAKLIRFAGADPASLTTIVTTHGHSDHHGGNALLQAMSGAEIVMGEQTAVWFANNDRHHLWLDYLGQEATLVPADRTVVDGDWLTLAGMDFRVIASPGHAPDAISLYQPDLKLLLCADAMWENDVGILNTAVHGPEVLEAAIATLERFAQLDINMALPGHGNPIPNVPENIAQIQQRLARFHREPQQMALHLIRRATMFNLLRFQPIVQEAFIERCLAWPWLFDYAPLAGFDHPRPLLTTLLDEFLNRGLIQNQNKHLITTLPK